MENSNKPMGTWKKIIGCIYRKINTIGQWTYKKKLNVTNYQKNLIIFRILRYFQPLYWQKLKPLIKQVDMGVKRHTYTLLMGI